MSAGTRGREIDYVPKAVKELAKLDKAAARRITQAVSALADDPLPGGSRPLVGYPDLLRLRIGDYRVIYAIENDKILVLRVAHRREVYRNL